ncbi:hypothetical protein BJ085DRAFT_37050, partial [Dimargaris cristalligena]
MVDSASMTSRSAPDIPQIPLSSLTQLSIVYAHSVAAAGQKLAKAKRNSGAPGSVGLAQLRRLIEEDKIQRNRLAHIHQTTAQIAQRRITEWSPETLALCLTSIDTQMVERIDIDDLERRLAGAVAVRFDYQDSTVCVVNCHLAANMNQVERRNQDFHEICRRLLFAGRSDLQGASSAISPSATTRTLSSPSNTLPRGLPEPPVGPPELPERAVDAIGPPARALSATHSDFAAAGLAVRKPPPTQPGAQASP